LSADDNAFDLHIGDKFYDAADITFAFGREKDWPLAADVRHYGFEANVGGRIRQRFVFCVGLSGPRVRFRIPEGFFQFLELFVASPNCFVKIDRLPAKASSTAAKGCNSRKVNY
jgi:hypothetical protein